MKKTWHYVTHKQMHANTSRHNQLRLYNIDLKDIYIYIYIYKFKKYAMCFRENICTCIIHHISKKYFQFSTIHTSRKIAYTKIYRTKKLINKFLDQVKYPI